MGFDDLMESLNNNKEKLKFIQMNSQPGFIKGITITSFKSKIAYIEELLAIKSRINEIKEIDFYFENREALIELLGW